MGIFDTTKQKFSELLGRLAAMGTTRPAADPWETPEEWIRRIVQPPAGPAEVRRRRGWGRRRLGRKRGQPLAPRAGWGARVTLRRSS